MPFYRKKSVVIEARLVTRDSLPVVKEWSGGTATMLYAVDTSVDLDSFFIHALEGPMRVALGDYVIKGVWGEFYPIHPNIFLETYELAEGEHAE